LSEESDPTVSSVSRSEAVRRLNESNDESPEETASASNGRRGRSWKTNASVGHVLSVHGLLILTCLLIVLFSVLLPNTFPTLLTLRAITLGEAPVALLALGETLCIASDNYDLSVGYAGGLISILVVLLHAQSGLSWEAASAVALVAGVGIGVGNAILIHYVKIDSFIATLGVGTVLYGLGEWYTNGQEIPGTFPKSFESISGGTIAGVPMPAVYVLIVAAILWAAIEFLPIGRYIYAVGSNREAAGLAGIRINRVVITVFVVSGVCAALAGILLASTLQTADSDIGTSLLLPAFVAPMLGAAAVKPGQVNIWGTMIAIVLLSVGIAGLQQLGGSFWTENVFDGGALIIAVGLSGLAGRRGLAALRKSMSTATRPEK
jgi:ribose transport system permease protein